jgi:hypothetical protein
MRPFVKISQPRPQVKQCKCQRRARCKAADTETRTMFLLVRPGLSPPKIQHAPLSNDRPNARRKIRDDALQRARLRDGTFVP